MRHAHTHIHMWTRDIMQGSTLNPKSSLTMQSKLRGLGFSFFFPGIHSRRLPRVCSWLLHLMREAHQNQHNRHIRGPHLQLLIQSDWRED